MADDFAEPTREMERVVDDATPDGAVAALRAAGLLPSDVMAHAMDEQRRRGGQLLDVIAQLNLVAEADIAQALSRAARITMMSPGTWKADERCIRRLPRTFLLARRVLPVHSEDPALLRLAMVDPFANSVVEEMQALLHCERVERLVATRTDILAGIQRAYAVNQAEQQARIILGTADDDKVPLVGARLAAEGMTVEHVNQGAVLKDIISKHAPSAVLCDARLPGIDALNLLLWLRNESAHVDLPFFVMGPRQDDALMQRALDLGADDYVGEPLRLDPLVAKLRRVVGRAPRSPSQPPMAAPTPSLPLLPTPPPRRKSSPPRDVVFDFPDLPDLPSIGDGIEMLPDAAFPPADIDDDVPSMPTGVMGTLRQMALPEIVQSLEMGRKTARVDIVPTDGEKGTLAFEAGALRYADYGLLTGDEAFYRMMRHSEGFFRIHYGDAPSSINIHQPTTFLLLEAMRLMDESSAR
jgi:CheY-like chemotaxis protein